MNIINNNTPAYHQNKIKPLKANTNFKGHGGHEILEIGKDSLLLRHETAFFREYNTLNKGINYLRQHFPKEKNPRIIVGACSTGEEALSIKMLMPDKKPKILGFDISPNSIAEAKTGIYTISQPKDDISRKFISWLGISAYKDEFLGFGKPKTHKEKILKNLFNKNFTQIAENSAPEKNPIKKFFNKLCFKFLKNIDPEFNDKIFALNDPKNTGCEFIQGDIQHLDEIAPKGKAHAISFRNAMYHLITMNNENEERIQKPIEEVEPMLNHVAKQINKALTKDGIFMLGELEDKQLTDTKLLSRIFKENGFKEVAKTKNGYCNIWAKVKDVE